MHCNNKQSFASIIILVLLVLSFCAFCLSLNNIFLHSTTTSFGQPQQQKVWTKQKFLSEIMRNYIEGCQRITIVKEHSIDSLQMAIANGQVVLDRLRIFVDVDKFCRKKDMDGHYGGADCFSMLKSGGVQRLMTEYRIRDDNRSSLGTLGREMVCKILQEMEHRMVGDNDVKQMIVDELMMPGGHHHLHPDDYEDDGLMSSHEDEPVMGYPAPMMTPMLPYGLMPATGMVPSNPSKPFQIGFKSREVAAVLWHLADLLDRLCILYYTAKLIRVNVKTETRIKIHNRGLNAHFTTDMSIIAHNRRRDACSVLNANRDVYGFFMMVTSSNTGDPQVNLAFAKMKDRMRLIERQIHIPPDAPREKVNCVHDLFLLRAMLELYRAFIVATELWLSNVRRNDPRSHRIFCDSTQSICTRAKLVEDLADMKREADLMKEAIEGWFRSNLPHNYMEWDKFRHNHIDEKFHVQIVDRPGSSFPSNPLSKIRQAIFQPKKRAYRPPDFVQFVRQQHRRNPARPAASMPVHHEEIDCNLEIYWDMPECYGHR